MNNNNKRFNQLLGQFNKNKKNSHSDEKYNGININKVNANLKKENSLTIIDNRTNKKLIIPIKNGTINAKSLLKFKTKDNKVGIRSYDPGYMNTASATSRITFINGGKGQLLYRGYPIEELAEKSNFLEVSYLLIYGELPTKTQFDYYSSRIMKHTMIHEDLKTMMKSFRYDSHPMGMIISTLMALSTFHPEANPALQGQDLYKTAQVKNKHIHRAIGTITTISAYAYRHRIGRPYVDPSVEGNLTYSENFLYMLDKIGTKSYTPHPRLAKALDILFILHADHELNCSTSAMRHLTSSGVDVYTSLGGAAAALYGPRHGGANEAVLRMLEGIGSVENIPSFIEKVKAKKVKLMGFGHRVYKNYDPRARIIRKVAEEVFEVTGREPLIELAVELERIALSDPYFVKRKLYPNVDFYSGLIYKAMGFPTDYFPVLFTIPRTVGWLSHWAEFLDDPENRIVRPRQVYLGYGPRSYVEVNKRKAKTTKNITSNVTKSSKRRNAAKEYFSGEKK